MLSTVLLTGGAWAQETQGPMQRGVALNQFDPSPAGDDFFSLPSPHSVGETVEPRAKLVFDAASKPLRLVGEMDTADIVDSQIFMHVNVSMAFFDRLLIDALVPVAIAQSGDNPSLQGIDAQSPSSAEIADMRVGLRIRLYGEYQDPFQIGIGSYVFVPTRGEGAFVGEGSVRVTPYLTAGGRFNAGIDWIYTAYGGFAVRGSNNSSAMRYGAGFAADLFDGLWQIGPEFFASTPVQDAPYQLSEVDVIPADDSTNAELMLCWSRPPRGIRTLALRDRCARCTWAYPSAGHAAVPLAGLDRLRAGAARARSEQDRQRRRRLLRQGRRLSLRLWVGEPEPGQERLPHPRRRRGRRAQRRRRLPRRVGS